MTAGSQSAERDASVELRPGVFRPDWSVVTTATAKSALRCRATARSGLIEKWLQALTPEEDLAWRTTLQLYGQLGRRLSIPEISVAARLTATEMLARLQQLEERDLLTLGADGATLLQVYPFGGKTSGHLITLRGYAFDAMCAIDALGAGAMYGCNVGVVSACRYCGSEIRATTAGKGKALGKVSPEYTVVWLDQTYSKSAATSCCLATAFFCSDDHLDGWLSAQTFRRDGMRLSMFEALEVGKAIFGPVLRAPVQAR